LQPALSRRCIQSEEPLRLQLTVLEPPKDMAMQAHDAQARSTYTDLKQDTDWPGYLLWTLV
jgi:hypothetical protein